jgi:tagatose-6-phosphate ketose/aldose isomerase
MILGYEEKELEELKGIITAKEIVQQPLLWIETLEIFKENLSRIKAYMDDLNKVENLRVIITGAGTSAFVGETVAPYLLSKTGKRVEAIATTDIVQYPEYYLQASTPTLLINIARSGDSPESVAAVELAEKLIKELYQITFTCNKAGYLAKKMMNNEKNLLLLMPEKSNDLGFAMTGSFSSMMLSCILLYNLDNLNEMECQLNKIKAASEHILKDNVNILKEISEKSFKRIVYVGGGMFQGLSRESCLKVLELTAGKISTLYESILGLRHGPKSIIDDNTLVILYLSKNEYARKYEIDLLKEMYNEKGGKKIAVIASEKNEEAINNSDYYLYNDAIGYSDIKNHLLIFPYILNAQILAFFSSLNLKITPDNPCPSGSVNRVVKGVNIYNYK